MKRVLPLIFLLTFSPSAFAALGEFVPHNIGYPVARYEPVDVDGDGVWELAVLTAESPARCGIYSAEREGWVEGPRELPVAGLAWGVGDWNNDGITEYVYLSDGSIRHMDTQSGVDSLLRTVDFRPLDLFVWGRTADGRPTVGLRRSYSYSYSVVDTFHERYSESVSDVRWQIEALFEGDSILQVSAENSARPLRIMTPGGDQYILIYRSWYRKTSATMRGVSGTFRQDFSAFDIQWRPHHHSGLPGYSYSISDLPRDGWALMDADIVSNGASGALIITWEDKHGGSGVDLPQYYGAYEAASPAHTLWTKQYSPGWPNSGGWGPIPHRSLAVYDLEFDGPLEIIMPLREGGGTEIRLLQTGRVLDTLVNIPQEMLKSDALYQPGLDNLYFVSESSLWVWEIPTDTIVRTTSTTANRTLVFTDTSAIGDTLYRIDRTVHERLTIVTDSTYVTDRRVINDLIVVADTTVQADTSLALFVLNVLPRSITLHAYPNPFNSDVTLSWSTATEDARLEFVNSIGQSVCSLTPVAGQTQIQWNGCDQKGNRVPSGVYFARFSARNTTATLKIVLLK